MARVVVEVMPKPEILDPQGKAVTGALERLGFAGLQVRQGKRFEIEIDGKIDDAAVAKVREAAEKLLCNTVIENFEVHVEDQAVAEKAEAVTAPRPGIEPTKAQPTQPVKAAPAGAQPVKEAVEKKADK
ncbi:hypothetical protein GCM10027418_08020 [Mariniluteicoccus endophyticus]